MNIIDISTDLLLAEIYPGDPEPRLQLVNRMDCDDDYNLSAIYASLHTGTHIDAPSHIFEEETSTINDIPLEKFVGPVSIITLPEGPITGEVVEELFPKDAKKVIIKSNGKAYFFGGAAEDVADLGYDLLGFDGISIGGDSEIEVHRALLGNGTVLLEGLDLTAVDNDGEYFLMAQPIKIDQREAAFCRAILIEDYVFWSSKR